MYKDNSFWKHCGYLLGLLVMLCLLLPSDLFAREITANEVSNAVETWVHLWTPDARPDAVIEELEPYTVGDETVAYIAHLSGGGYCLCGANSLVLPVYHYSPNGTYDSESPNCRVILEDIAARTRFMQVALAENDPKIQPYLDRLSDREQDWSDLMSGFAPQYREGLNPKLDPVAIELPLACEWGQGSPENDQCPSLSPPPYEEPVLTGCNGTAMAQMMYYWKWPETGYDEHTSGFEYRRRSIGNWDSVYLENDPGISEDWPTGIQGMDYERLRWDPNTQMLEMTGYWDWSLRLCAHKINESAYFQAAVDYLYDRLTAVVDSYTVYPGSSFYDWAAMPTQPADPPDYGNQEVAELMYHVGVTIDNIWGIVGTASSHNVQMIALPDHFRYHSDVQQATLDPTAMVIEMQYMRPVGMGGGNDDGGGHAWVAHGYDTSYTNWRFLQNMGWDGSDNGWYTLDDLPGEFHNDQSNLIYMAPTNVYFVGGLGHTGSPRHPFGNIEEALAGTPDNYTLIFLAGGTFGFNAENLVLNRPMTFKGIDVTIQHY